MPRKSRAKTAIAEQDIDDLLTTRARLQAEIALVDLALEALHKAEQDRVEKARIALAEAEGRARRVAEAMMPHAGQSVTGNAADEAGEAAPEAEWGIVLDQPNHKCAKCGAMYRMSSPRCTRCGRPTVLNCAEAITDLDGPPT